MTKAKELVESSSETKESYLSLPATIIAMVVSFGGGASASLAAWWVLKHTHFPPFSSSNVLKAISTLCSALLIIVVAALLLWWVLSPVRPKWRRWLTYLVAYLSPAGLVTAVLAIPLSATRLYLDGISVDQVFRTQYLTRMTAQFGLHDMAYAGLPTFYPAGWFLTGGRFADLVGLPGWAAFQPWAILTLAGTSCLLVPVWQRITGSLPLATTIALTTTAVMLTMSAEEPYAAITGMGIPAVSILAWRALLGSRWSAVATSIFLGISATLYTLFTGVNAMAIVIIALVVAVRTRSVRPIVRIVGIGLGSILIALTVWAPYIKGLLTLPHGSTSAAQHYLPVEGTQLPVPMFAFTFAGVLCLIGLIWLIVNIRHRTAIALSVSVLAYYGWALLSMLATLHGTTMLGFRLQPPIVMLLCTAGVLALADVKVEGLVKLYPQQARAFAPRVTAVIGVLAAISGVAYAASIPLRIEDPINLAYSDTDGDGQRADRFAADSGAFYQKVADTIGTEPTNTVVLTDEKAFMAYRPYLAFQAFTAHYANPLSEFDKRNQEIEKWSQAKDSQQLLDEMNSSPWRRPDVIMFRGNVNDAAWRLSVADDVYPSNPNVLFRVLDFNSSLFKGWDVHQVGPFVVAKHP